MKAVSDIGNTVDVSTHGASAAGAGLANESPAVPAEGCLPDGAVQRPASTGDVNVMDAPCLQEAQTAGGHPPAQPAEPAEPMAGTVPEKPPASPGPAELPDDAADPTSAMNFNVLEFQEHALQLCLHLPLHSPWSYISGTFCAGYHQQTEAVRQ